MPPTMLTLTPPDSEWMDQAACSGSWDLMEGENDQDVRQAKELCSACPARRRCLAWALSLPPRQDVYGVAGGMTRKERDRARRRIRRYRREPEPPKTCTRCKETKPAEEFYLRPRLSGGRDSRCRGCFAEIKRMRRDAARAAAKRAAGVAS